MSAPAPHPTGYATPRDMLMAVRARATTAAKDTGLPKANVLRQFVYDRFLARVFHNPGNGWVLKGGTALLARVRSARHSKDIDLFLAEGTLDTAIAELRAVAELDLRDHLTFVVPPGPPTRSEERPHQPDTALATIHVDSYMGATNIESFTVDVVTGSLITQPAERYDSEPLIRIPGIVSPPYRLYPVVDHIADKLCATIELLAGRPSSRTRDLVDLVVIARTQRVDAMALREAIRSEQDHRQLALIDRWSCPETWVADYPGRARDVIECAGYRTFTAATTLVASFLDPVLSGELGDGHEWSPTELSWQQTPPPD